MKMSQNVTIRGPILCEKAKKLAVMLGNENFMACLTRDLREISFQTNISEEKSAPINDA